MLSRLSPQPFRASLTWAGLAGIMLTIAACGAAGDGAGLLPSPSMAVSADAADAPANPFLDADGLDLRTREVIKSPTIAQVMKPAGALPELSLGRPDAPVTMIKYASMTCPYCRKFQAEVFPVLKRTYIDTGKLRYILREFPIGRQSGLATIALRCAKPSQSFRLYDKLMSQQSSWVSQEVRAAPIFKVAAQVGMTRGEFDACRQNQSMIKALAAVKERGRTLGVIGTPNFFINAKLYKRVLTMEEIRQIVDPLIAAGVPAVAGKS